MNGTTSTMVPNPEYVRLLGLSTDERGIIAAVASTSVGSICSRCGDRSGRVHSRYARYVSGLPWQGMAFRLELHVQRFFCDHAECPQQIFTERLQGVIVPSTRATLRFA